MRKNFLKVSALLGIIALVIATIFLPANNQVSAAPFAAPTPQTYNASRADAAIVVFAAAKSITADTRWCKEAANYNAMDVQWVIDQGTTNSTDLKLQFSNDNVNFTDGATLVSSNTADASGLNRQLTYGRYVCVYADVTNSNAIVISAYGVGK